MQDLKNAKRVVVKVGTSTLTYSTGQVNIRRVEKLVKVLADIANSGVELAVVSSGAIAVGVGKLGLRERPRENAIRQAAAAVGQCELMHIYDQSFGRFNHTVAQLLLTRDVVDDPKRRQNVTNTFTQLFAMGAIPIINENDTVSTDELEGESFGDNDQLSALVATLIKADALIVLSDIDGLYTADPQENPDAKLIGLVEEIGEEITDAATGSKSNRGTGGMATKIQAAKTAVGAGITMAIINGQNPENLYTLLEGGPVGTVFKAQR
ncbi:MAG: glutamate 5-kinase [Oscillospiraceae bacterium]|nr:glutamate 5-kinase [Oscillospiraceae bacterium]